MNLTKQQIIEAANKVDCHPAAIMAVIHVETPWPHVGDVEPGKPLILNERHWFYKLTGTLPVSRTHPKLSNKKPGGYCKGNSWKDRQKCEHERLKIKLTIHREAALKSISMGLFQVMGFNYAIIGYSNVEEMWKDALKVDDSIDLDWFLEFIKVNKLDDELRRLDWSGFARGYNGPSYRKNHYDDKLHLYYHKFLDSFDNIKTLDESRNNLDTMYHSTTTGFPDFSQTL